MKVKAWLCESGQLVYREVELAEPGPGEVRVRIAAAGLNRADIAQAAGNYPPPPGASPVLGLECSGIIEAVGPGVERWAVGDPVCALLAGGGYAEAVVVPAVQVLPVPAHLDLVDAAALPEVFATAWLNLVDEGGLLAGERVLIHAGASGVGTAALQLCRLLGAEAYAVCSGPDKVAFCLELGAKAVHDRRTGPFTDAPWAKDLDLVLDPVGGTTTADGMRCLAVGGRLVLIGLMGGREATLDLGRLMVRRLRLVGSVLRARSVAEKGALVERLVHRVWPHVHPGGLHPVIQARLPLDQAPAALAELASNQTIGKILLVGA